MCSDSFWCVSVSGVSVGTRVSVLGLVCVSLVCVGSVLCISGVCNGCRFWCLCIAGCASMLSGVCTGFVSGRVMAQRLCSVFSGVRVSGTLGVCLCTSGVFWSSCLGTMG